MGMREKDQADVDLESFIELFDEALTSDDPNVQKTLQHLMTIVALTRNHNRHDFRSGPLRRLFEDMRDIHRRLSTLENGGGGYRGGGGLMPGPFPSQPFQPYPTTSPTTVPYTNPIWTTTNPSTTWGGHGVGGPPTAIAHQSTTGFAYDPLEAHRIIKNFNSGGLNKIAERVDDLLNDEKYKGSSVNVSDIKTT
jgi:hypothetical protein